LRSELQSSYFAIGTDPDQNEKPDTILTAAGVYKSGIWNPVWL
jgi:hypothetical protein